MLCMENKIVSKYEHGKIYRIWNTENDKIYIGSTVAALHKRMWKHRADAKLARNYKNSLYIEMNRLGHEHFKIELVEDYPCKSRNELNRREGEFIREYNSKLNKQIAGRTQKEYYDDNKDMIATRDQKYRNENKDKIKVRLRRYFEDNQEHLSEKAREYYKDNKDIIRERQRLYRIRVSDELKVKTHEYYERNKEKIKERQKEYYGRNKEKIKEHNT